MCLPIGKTGRKSDVMRYLVKKVGIGKDAKNVIVSETDNKDVAIAEAKKCYSEFNFTDKLFYRVAIFENNKEIITIAYCNAR